MNSYLICSQCGARSPSVRSEPGTPTESILNRVRIAAHRAGWAFVKSTGSETLVCSDHVLGASQPSEAVFISGSGRPSPPLSKHH